MIRKCGQLWGVILLAGLAANALPVGAAEGTDDIWTATARGDLDAIKQHLAAGQDVNAKAPGSNVTPLMIAAITGQTEAADLLLAKGADPNLGSNDGSTALHMAAFFGHPQIVKALLAKGANVNVRNQRSQTPLDTVKDAWSEELEGIYRGIGGALKLELDLEKIKAARPRIAALLEKHGGQSARQPVTPTRYRGAYYMNGRIYVNTFGTPEGDPLVVPEGRGQEDFKPSWSKTGDMLVFFRRLKNDPVVTNWKTQIYIINVDGTGLHPLTDGTHTDFNPTWTRDGTNTPIWNRRHPDRVSFYVMASKVGAEPGEEYPLTDKSYHTWAYSCLKDGRILVQCAHPKLGWGYYLMTPNPGGEPKFQRIDCELARHGILDRVSISPSETRVCFEYQKGFEYKDPGRTLYIADFDAKRPSITNARPFANKEGANRWFAYPRWTQDEKAVVYHASPSLYMYFPETGATIKVSTRDGADYRYPHCEATPK